MWDLIPSTLIVVAFEHSVLHEHSGWPTPQITT